MKDKTWHKQNRENNKRLSDLYHSVASRPDESFTEFKRRMKKQMGY